MIEDRSVITLEEEFVCATLGYLTRKLATELLSFFIYLRLIEIWAREEALDEKVEEMTRTQLQDKGMQNQSVRALLVGKLKSVGQNISKQVNGSLNARIQFFRIEKVFFMV